MTTRLLLPAALVAMALAGAALVMTGGDQSGVSEPSSISPEDAHAAAGVTVVGPEVAAAFEQRVQELRARLSSSPDDRGAVLELARLLHDGHRGQESLALYRRAIELDPADAQPYYDLASAHAGLGQWAEARAILQERLSRSPGDAVAMFDMGAVEANAGDPDAAVLWWRRARESSSDVELRARVDAAISQVRAGPDTPAPK